MPLRMPTLSARWTTIRKSHGLCGEADGGAEGQGPQRPGPTGKPLEASSNYRKAVRFADPELKKLLEGCNEQLLAARRALEQQLTGGRLLLKMPLPRRRPPSMSGRISGQNRISGCHSLGSFRAYAFRSSARKSVFQYPIFQSGEQCPSCAFLHCRGDVSTLCGCNSTGGAGLL